MSLSKITAASLFFLVLIGLAFAQVPEEVCDGIDNNFNDLIDEGLSYTFGSDEGLCELGTTDCVNGEYVNTTNAVLPSTELCDGLDNDCDSFIDNGFNVLESCISSANSCGDTSVGNYICSLNQTTTVCSAAAPAERTNWHLLCRSKKNWCGDANYGYTDCNGVCLAVRPAERSYWLQPCWVQNACGQSTQGITDCNGECDAVPLPVSDMDSDGVPDCYDNCVSIYNPNQEDYDLDGIGAVCDPDDSGGNGGNSGGNGGNPGTETNQTNNQTNNSTNNQTGTGNTGTNTTTNETTTELDNPKPRNGGSSGGRSFYFSSPEYDYCYWNCSAWYDCIDGKQVRDCTYHDCAKNVSVETERACQVIIEPEVEYICTPDWNCTEWSDCIFGIKTRSCFDMRNCTNPGEPNTTMNCEKLVQVPEEEAQFPWWLLLLILALLLLLFFLFKKKKEEPKKVKGKKIKRK